MVDLVQSAPLTINIVFFFSSASPTWHVALLPKGLSLEARTPIRFNSLKTVSCTVGWKILAFLLNTSNTETSCWFNVGSCPIRFKWMLITLMNWQLRNWRSHKRLQVKRPTGTTVLDPDCSKNVSTVCHDRCSKEYSKMSRVLYCTCSGCNRSMLCWPCYVVYRKSSSIITYGILVT